MAISPHERLSATLRYLATGRKYADLKFTTAISASSLCKIVPETCKAIIKVRKDYMKVSSSKNSLSLLILNVCTTHTID
jgi:hypothetical protein